MLNIGQWFILALVVAVAIHFYRNNDKDDIAAGVELFCLLAVFLASIVWYKSYSKEAPIAKSEPTVTIDPAAEPVKNHSVDFNKKVVKPSVTKPTVKEMETVEKTKSAEPQTTIPVVSNALIAPSPPFPPN